jgi:Putative prokaryotic signal transducing protein
VIAEVRLTVVADELEAAVICGRLRTEGIACNERRTDMGAGAWEATGSGGPREILVAPSDLERARKLLAPETSRHDEQKEES